VNIPIGVVALLCSSTVWHQHLAWQISHEIYSLFLNSEISFLCPFFFIGHGSYMDCALGRGINLAYRFVPGKKNLAWICFYHGTTRRIRVSNYLQQG
jgi:hypothetical protein